MSNSDLFKRDLDTAHVRIFAELAAIRNELKTIRELLAEHTKKGNQHD